MRLNLDATAGIKKKREYLPSASVRMEDKMAKPGMRSRYRLDASAADDFEELLKYREQWNSIIDASNGCRPASSVYDFSRHLAEENKWDEEVVGTVLRVFYNLRNTRSTVKLGGDEFMSFVIEQVIKHWNNDGERVEQLRDAREQLKDLLSQVGTDSPLMISSKAQGLVYDRENILRKFRIITDARPVFNEGADQVCEMLVTHNLVIEYEDRSGQHELYLGIDASDLDLIRASCDRADLKAKTIQKALGDQGNWRVVVFPEHRTGETV